MLLTYKATFLAVEKGLRRQWVEWTVVVDKDRTTAYDYCAAEWLHVLVNKELFPYWAQNPKSALPPTTSRGVGEKMRVHHVVQSAEGWLRHLNSSSKLFPVLSTPIKTHCHANTYMLPQFAFYSNMSGHFMSAHSQPPTEASGKAQTLHLVCILHDPCYPLASGKQLISALKGCMLWSVWQSVWYLD